MARSEPRREGRLSRLRWSLGVSLTSRILAVNIIALGLLAGSLFYLDSYRNRLLAERYQLARAEVEVAAGAMALSSRTQSRALVVQTAVQQKLRLRLYGRDGALVADSFALAEPAFTFVDPASEPWYLQTARSLDRGMDFLLGAAPIPDYREPEKDNAAAWPEVVEAQNSNATVIRQRQWRRTEVGDRANRKPERVWLATGERLSALQRFSLCSCKIIMSRDRKSVV